MNNQTSNSYSRSSSSAHPSAGMIVEDEDGISLIDLLDNVLYYRWYLIVVTILGGLLSVGYALTATPIYSANALIQVQNKKGNSLLGSLDQVGSLGSQGPSLGSEIEILRSRSVIGLAVEKLKINISVSVANRVPILGNFLARNLSVDQEGLVIPPIDSIFYAWGGEKLDIERIKVPAYLHGKPLLLTIGQDRTWQLVLEDSNELLATGTGAGEIITGLNGEFVWQLGAFTARPKTVFRVVVRSLQSSINGVLGSLTTDQANRQSDLIKAAYQSANPVFAARMLNTIAEVYLTQNAERSSAEAKQTLVFLNNELPRVRQALDDSELALNTFRSQTLTVDVTSEMTDILAISSGIESQKLALEIKQRQLALRYDKRHPVMQDLQTTLTGLTIQSEDIAKRLRKLPLAQQDFIRLARNVEVNNQLYIGLLNNTQQLEIAKAGILGNVAIIDAALVPEYPIKPKKSLIVAVGTLASLILGIALTQLMAMVAKVVRDPKKLEMKLGIQTLSVMPLVAEQLEQDDMGTKKVFMMAQEMPDSPGIEALRSLRTALLFALSEKTRSKTILITSAVPGQGKSFLSANLSYLLAAMGNKTLLIDADIRKSSLKKYFTHESDTTGLTNALRDELPVNDAIIKEAYPNLDFLPPGPRARNPGDLLSGEKIQQIIHDSAEQYDFVVIDSPPLLPVHDARALAKAVDVSLFVVRQDAVSLNEVEDAIDVFNKSGNRIDGLIFNGFVPSRVRYGYGYGYGYSGKYGRYGKYKKYATYGKYGSYGQSDRDEGRKG
jgi:tyrosine-protein kinase Etk/Wzc